MKVPSKKELCELLDLDDAQADLVRALCANANNREELEVLIEKNCPQTWQYANSCHSWPFDNYMWRCTMVLHALNCILGTHGVEVLHTDDDSGAGFPTFECCIEYCNTGDTYAPTLFYNSDTDTLFISSYGDVAEDL